MNPLLQKRGFFLTKYSLRRHHLPVSSINPYVTFNYVQPHEYHFSHDSVFLARKVFEIIKDEKIDYSRTLDLCSGCGIIGLDLAFHLQNHNLALPKKIDFLEVQKIYEPFFKKNVETFSSVTGKSITADFINLNYDQLITTDETDQEKYNLIVSNPPYFRKNQGLLSKSDFKNRCRFFIDSDLKNLILSIENSLSEQGKAFILLKSLAQHGVQVEHEIAAFNTNLTFKHLGLIRETDLYQITK